MDVGGYFQHVFTLPSRNGDELLQEVTGLLCDFVVFTLMLFVTLIFIVISFQGQPSLKNGSLFTKLIIVIIMLIKNLTRSDYYKQNRLPLISLTHKLEPELPVFTHLLQVMPRLSTEIEKIESQKGTQNKGNLELANALKIIHELQDELEIVTTKCNDYEDEILSNENDIRELERKVIKHEEKIVSLQNTLQKNEFSTKSKLEYEKECFNIILNQYESKIEEMSRDYEQLKFDRQRELLRAKSFHQDSIFQTNMKKKQFQDSTQEDIKKLQRQIQKGMELNTLLRQKITDLQTLNQGHIRNLERINTQLSQTNLKLKSENDHILISQKTNLGLSENKINVLQGALSLLEYQLRKEKNLRQEEKKILQNRCHQTERNEKISFNETNKQIERVQEELYRKTIVLGERERQESNLKYKMQRLERSVTNLMEEKQRMVEDHERSKKQIAESLILEHHLKIDAIHIEHDRFVSQQRQRAAINERKATQNYYCAEITKYADLNRRLENDNKKYLQAIKITQDCSRRLQANLTELKTEIQQLTFQKRQITESLKNEIKQIREEFETKLRKQQQRLMREIDEKSSDQSVEEFRLKQSYDLVIKELNGVVEMKRTQISELKGKLKQVENLYAFEKNKFQFKIQDLEICIARIKCSNERLSRANQDLEIKVENDSSLRNSSQTRMKYEVLNNDSYDQKCLENENKILAEQKINIEKEYEDYRQKTEATISQLKNSENEKVLNFQKLEQQFIYLSRKLQQTQLNLENVVDDYSKESQKLSLLKEQLHKTQLELENEKYNFTLHISQLNITKHNLEKLLLQANQKLQNYSLTHQKTFNQQNIEIQNLRCALQGHESQLLEMGKGLENGDQDIKIQINDEKTQSVEKKISSSFDQKQKQETMKLEEQIRLIFNQKLILQATLAQFNEESQKKIRAIREELTNYFQKESVLKGEEIRKLKLQCLKAKQLEQEVLSKEKKLNNEKEKFMFDILQKDAQILCLREQLESLIRYFETQGQQKQILEAKWKLIFDNLIMQSEQIKKVEKEQIERALLEKISKEIRSEKINRTEKSERSWKTDRIFYSMIKNSPQTLSNETCQNENNFSKIDQREFAEYFNCRKNDDKYQKTRNMIESELYPVQPPSALRINVVKLNSDCETKEYKENLSMFSNQENHSDFN